MKELLTYIARNLVEKPDEVSVNEIDCDGEIVLELRVAPEDMGKVIGRQGRIASNCAVVRSFAQRKNTRVSVRIPGLRALPYQEYPVTSCPPDSCGSAFYSIENR